MASTSTHTFELDCSPDKAVEILSGEAFEVAQQSAQEGTKSCEYKLISSNDEQIVYELLAIEYAKGVKGVDKSKTESSVTHVTWDLTARKSSWTYEGAQGKRVKVWGGTRVVPRGEGCRVTTEFSVDIKIPLIGRQIEKIVVRESDKHMKSTFGPLAEEMAED